MTSVLEERANFTRLCRLLVDKGTKALRIALDGRHPPANLPHVLNANTAKLKQLKHRGIIDDSQMDLLFPPSGDSPDSKTFDITLINILLRNFCGLPCPATGWNTMPPDTDNSFGANIARIKLMRNKFYAHVPKTEVDKSTFEDLWQNISLPLLNLNISQEEINELKHGFLGPEEKNYVQILTQWISDDSTLGDLTRDVKLILKQQEDLQQSVQRLEGGIAGLVDRRVYESSYSLLSNINETHLLINSKDLTYDGKRVRWTRTFEKLQNFVADVLEERGRWSPKVSCSRKFTSSISDLGLTWYYTKQKTLLFRGHSGTKLKEILIKLCEISTSIESTRSEGRQNKNIEIVSVIEDAASASASASTIDGVSCKCPCATGILTELEKIKLNIESLESKIDALQSLANAQKVSFTPNDYSSEVRRLKQELFEERHKTSQLESDLAFLKKKTLPHKQSSLMHSVNGGSNKGSGNLCIGGINLPLIDVPEETCFPNQSISTTVINNVSHTLEMTSSQNQSELRSGTMPIVNRQIMDKENSMLGISPYSKQSSTIPTLSEQLIHKTHHANKKSTQRCSSRINFNRLPLFAKTVNRFVKVNKYSKCGKNLFPR